MLDQGDDAVLAAPKADFFREMEIMHLPRPKFVAHNANDFASEAAEADADDLHAALRERHLTAEKQNQILQSLAVERAKLTDLRTKLQSWSPEGEVEYINGEVLHHEPKPRPTMENVNVSTLADVPGEFVDYLQGSVAWFNGQTNAARIYWETLLQRPAAERHYRSTWAAYMLGRSWTQDDPETAIGYFRQVRVLKLNGFSDRIGLAESSLGEEARVCLRQKKFDEAFHLYIAQLGAGDGTAASSLRFACRDILNAGVDLTALAQEKATRQVMTAFIIADAYSFEESIETNRLRWLEAVESADVKDVQSAETLALAAYQAGQWDAAQRWIQRAPQTPTAQWLQAKLLLRGGKVAQAAAILQSIAGLFPSQDSSTNDDSPRGLQDVLYMNRADYSDQDTSLRSQIRAESGVLHLARREYTESLDALLRSGFWMDAAYVSERVLSTQELKNYVDRNSDDLDASKREAIRHLLARRLARAGDFDEARAYYPSNLLSSYDDMVSSFDAANNVELPKEQRTDAYLTAAAIFHTNGWQLLSTEMWPDWGGSSSGWYGPTNNRQATNSIVVTATDDELQRARQETEPSLQFHYQYQAAQLAWDGAKLMADNTDDKARVLCRAGSWLKARDAKAADYFYKELVRRCRKTAIGALADRMRWFPTLDENGDPLPWKPVSPRETNGPAKEIPGLWYELNRGNILQDVADVARQDHNIETTVALIQEANPEININRLKAGLKIFVPAPLPPP